MIATFFYAVGVGLAGVAITILLSGLMAIGAFIAMRTERAFTSRFGQAIEDCGYDADLASAGVFTISCGSVIVGVISFASAILK